MIRCLERVLETDLALTASQVLRHYAVSLETCREAALMITPAFIAPTARSSRKRWVNFVSLKPLGLEGFELRHLAGVAEMRQVLRVEPRAWRVLGHAAETIPDAIWRRGLENWAVEFDAGAYTLKTVRKKARAFEAGFDGQVWGVSSGERKWLLEQNLDAPLLIVRSF